MFSTLLRRQDDLRARYAEPHRAYHTEAHLRAMLAGMDGLPIAHPSAVELAIWYHDAIYDPAAQDNEERSARLLEADMAGLADPALVRMAAAMVRATASHALPPDLPPAEASDCALLIDLDMAVLGAPAAEFAAYERGIAAEYVPVAGPDRYREGRRAFLDAQLRRPRLFLTPHFHDRLDTRARANLRAALDGG